MADQVYCTKADLELTFSAPTVTAWSDQADDGTADTATIDDAIVEASQEIELYARGRYTPAKLATSTLIKRWCVWMTGYYLSATRGNPVPNAIIRNYESAVAKLEKVRQEKFEKREKV